MTVAGGFIETGGTWESTGIIRVEAGELELGGTFDRESLDGFQRVSPTAGTVTLIGTLMVGGGEGLTLDDRLGDWQMEDGRIAYGTLNIGPGRRLIPLPGTNVLDHLTLNVHPEGFVDLAVPFARLRFNTDVVLNGRVSITGPDASLRFESVSNSVPATVETDTGAEFFFDPASTSSGRRIVMETTQLILRGRRAARRGFYRFLHRQLDVSKRRPGDRGEGAWARRLRRENKFHQCRHCPHHRKGVCSGSTPRSRTPVLSS